MCACAMYYIYIVCTLFLFIMAGHKQNVLTLQMVVLAIARRHMSRYKSSPLRIKIVAAGKAFCVRAWKERGGGRGVRVSGWVGWCVVFFVLCVTRVTRVMRVLVCPTHSFINTCCKYAKRDLKISSHLAAKCLLLDVFLVLFSAST